MFTVWHLLNKIMALKCLHPLVYFGFTSFFCFVKTSYLISANSLLLLLLYQEFQHLIGTISHLIWITKDKTIHMLLFLYDSVDFQQNFPKKEPSYLLKFHVRILQVAKNTIFKTVLHINNLLIQPVNFFYLIHYQFLSPRGSYHIFSFIYDYKFSLQNTVFYLFLRQKQR